MVTRSSKTLISPKGLSTISAAFVATLLPLVLTGCVKVYTTPKEDTVTMPPPPGPENIDPTLGKGEGPESSTSPSSVQPPSPSASPAPAASSVPPVSTIKATPEQPIPGQLTARYADSTINVREGPGVTYSVLFKAHPNDTVMITDEVLANDGYVWYEVQHNQWGWVREDLLALQEGYGIVTANQGQSAINVREGPGQSYRVMHIARAGDRAPIVEKAWDREGNAWYLLDFTYRGWIRGDLVTKGTARFN